MMSSVIDTRRKQEKNVLAKNLMRPDLVAEAQRGDLQLLLDAV